MLTSNIWCTGHKRRVVARLTDGAEMYPLRDDLSTFPFWVCHEGDGEDTCGAFVGTHHKTKQKYKPLGFLATPEVKRWRMRIHAILDPLWKTKKIRRGQAYAFIGNRLGRNYHTAEIYDVEEAQKVYTIVMELKRQLDPGPWNH